MLYAEGTRMRALPASLPGAPACAERFFNVPRWIEMPRGGHFAAMEEPALLADDLRTFFRPLRGDR